MKESGAFVTKHTVINYVNQLAAAQQLACLNATTGSVQVEGDGAGASTASGAGSSEPRLDHASKDKKIFQRKPIERSKSAGAGAGGASAKDVETRSGFRSAKPSRGGRMVPTLTVQIPRVDESSDVVSGQVKGSKGTGVVKVQNQFAGLDMVD